MEQVHRIKGVIGTTTKNVPGLLIRAWLIYNALLAAIAAYPSPDPTLPIFLAAIQALEAAQKATFGIKSKALTAARNVKAEALMLILESELAYAQGLADASPANAAAVLTGAGFVLRQVGVRNKPLLALALTATPGTILCKVNATTLVGRGVKKRRQINWQYSVDGGKSWLTAASTPLAQTEIANLPLLTQVLVRASATVSKVTGAWTDAASIVVH